jgi:predicted nucleotidyltransferase
MYDQIALSEITQKIVRQAKDSLGDKLDKVILYGSYAREDYDAESDIDVMVLADIPRENLWAARKLFNNTLNDLDTEYEYKYLVSLHVTDCATFYEFADVTPFFINVRKDGVELYARKKPYKTIQERFKDFNGEYEPIEINWGTQVGEEIW